MEKILITGFGPFREFSENPTERLVREFPDRDGLEIRREVLQVNLQALEGHYPSLLEEYQPDIIINTGLKASAKGINLETFAINHLKDKGRPQPIGETAAHACPLDTCRLAENLCRQGIPATHSDYAGSYYCNYVYYHSLQWGAKSIFVHIPYPTDSAAAIALEKGKLYPSLPFDLLQKGLGIVLNACLAENRPT